MKAAVLNHNNGVFDIENIQIDRPKGREVLVRVKASGLCHSDLHSAESNFGIPLPGVLGHELAGIVTELGPDASEFAVGDHVVGSLIQWCGHCKACLSGRSYQCEHRDEVLRSADEAPRLTRDGQAVTQAFGMGAFAEYALIHEHQLVKLPKSIPFPQASVLGCACVTGAGAVINASNVRPGDTVAIVGIGGVGLNVISGARLAGAAQIIAIDLQPAKEKLARKFGATEFIDASTVDPVQKVIELTNGGVDHSFEVVGMTATTKQAIRMTCVGGSTYLIGIQAPGKTVDIDILAEIIAYQRKIVGVAMGSTNIRRDIPLYANLYLQGRFNLDDLISQEINISAINEAYAELKNGAIARSVITSF